MSVGTSDPFVWWNGAGGSADGPSGGLCAASEIRISPFDHGLLVGDGVFETVRVYGGQPFAWRRHLDRLEHSAAGLGLGLPTREELRTAATAVLEANGLLDAPAHHRHERALSARFGACGRAPPTLVVAASEVVAGADATTVAISPWPRNRHGATAGSRPRRARRTCALAYAASSVPPRRSSNTQHQLCEATGSSVVVVSDGVVRTPRRSRVACSASPALVLELGPSLGLRVEETPLPLRALVDEADEAFLTSTVREVQGIAEIAGWGHKFDDALAPSPAPSPPPSTTSSPPTSTPRPDFSGLRHQTSHDLVC
ncbi:MAG: aminotransferase class IV [Acidimicrobiia bacterium]